MKVVRAKSAGACYGVQRALDMALAAVEDGGRAYTLGPLIHNPRIVESLRDQGIEAVDSVDEVPSAPDTRVIIRSHGVKPEVRDAVAAAGFEVIDATCPHVAHAQNAAAELAATHNCLIVVGEAGHPEVEGICAFAHRAGARVCVVGTPADLPSDLPVSLALVAQTTQRKESVVAILDELRARGFDPDTVKTICAATRQRQDAAAQLASEVDAIVVIGGRNSSNTTRLTELCMSKCARTFHIESEDELSADQFVGCETVGVTAGASTPEAHIAAVVEKLESF